jgi:hypothetical protein
MPYGYYTFVRWVVFGSGTYAAWQLLATRNGGTAWLCFILAMMFNPFFPVHLEREMWRGVDIAAAAVFVYSAVILRRTHGMRSAELSQHERRAV